MSKTDTSPKKRKRSFKFAEPVAKDTKSDSDTTKPPFSHTHQKTAYALHHAKMVEKGKKYWEEKEQYEPLSDLEWWQLKAAKDFETGVGQKFYRNGTLSTWTDEQIAALQREMQKTLDLAGYGDRDKDHIRVKTLQPAILPATTAPAPNMDDFASEIKRQQKQQNKDKDKPKAKAKTVEAKVTITEVPTAEAEEEPIYDFDDEIIHNGDSDEDDDDGKQSEYNGNSMFEFDAAQLKELSSMDDLAGKFDAKRMRNSVHRRTRTEALRVKLQNMQKELTEVTQLNSKQSVVLEEHKKKESVRDEEIQKKLNGLTGALQSANNELDRAEEQLTEKDEEIANLKRELMISRKMNTQLAIEKEEEKQYENEEDEENVAKGSEAVVGDKGGGGLTADDLLNQRIKDANRFAFMLSAMQEQLDFERKQFVKKIHEMELRLEHKDTQLNALYQLYNQLVTQTKQKSWWERVSGK